VVFLHGFGQDFQAFNEVYETLEGKCSFLSLHIFFHGESDIDLNGPLELADWLGIIEKLFDSLEIKKAHWMGFSMGGKFCLVSLQVMPQLFSELTLLAPDGVVMNPWYGFATQNFIGRFCLRLLLRYLPFLRFLVVVFSKMGLVKSSLGRFTEHQLSTAEKRELVLNVWIRFRKIWPVETLWRRNIKDLKIPVGIVLGKHDSIITVSKFRQKKKELTEVHWVELNAGHSNLIEKFAKTLKDSVRLDN
jgi:pimeloyl-ACP methyl ester carboxylesterase